MKKKIWFIRHAESVANADEDLKLKDFSGSDMPISEKGLKQVLAPLFYKYGVSLIFSGHEHSYQRFLYNGMYFIVTGGGGSHLRDQARISPYLMKFKKAYHFCIITPAGGFLRIRAIDLEANKIDDFKIPPATK